MNSVRLLVADLRSTSPVWTVTEAALRQLADSCPPGWAVRVIEASTVSDGDGGTEPSDEVMAAVRECEVYYGFGMARKLFGAAPQLKWIHSAAAGVASLLFRESVASPVVITNSAGVHAVPVSETVLAAVLHFFRGFHLAVHLQANATWVRDPFVGKSSSMRELRGARVLVVGAGGVGSEIARCLHFHGARCVGVRRRRELGTPAGFDAVVGLDELDTQLPIADVVVLSIPATAATRGLLDRRRMALLRNGAIVVNVARGSLLDETALLESLRSGSVGGAYLDVASSEPLDPASPLWHEPGVLITPHVSAVSPSAFWQREMDLFLENWRRYIAGSPLLNVVDKRAGY